MSEATRIITALSEEFDRAVIQTKPGSKPGAPYKPATKFVSHGSVTKRLNAVCPGWSSRVVEWHTYIDAKQELRCVGVTLEVTVPNAGSHQEFGTSASHRSFGDDAKNAISDALKRCAMRFGVAIDLWEDLDETDDDVLPQSPAAAQPRQQAPPRQSPAPRSTVQHAPVQQARAVSVPQAPAAIGRIARPATDEHPEWGWTEAWRFLKREGYGSPEALVAALGDYKTWTPGEVVTAIEQLGVPA